MPSYPASLTPLAWYSDDPTTLFTDTARTTAVTTDGQSIKGITDQGPNGYHLSQSTTANAPKWDAVKSTIQFEYNAVEYLNLPTIASVTNRNCTIVVIGELVTTLDGYDGTTNRTDMWFLSGGADVGDYGVHRGGLPQTYDGTDVRTGTSPLFRTSLQLMGFLATAGGTTVYGDAATQALTALASGTFTGGIIGNLSGANRSLQARVRDILIYAPALTSGNLASLLTYAQTRGVPSSITGNIAIAGDSNCTGVGCTLNRNWVNQLTLTTTTTRCNISEASLTLAIGATDAATLVDTQIVAGKTNVLIVQLGSNDFALDGTSAATLYANMKTYCLARQSAGWSKIIVAGMTPRTDVDIEAKRQALRTSLLGDFVTATGQSLTWTGAAYADYYVDIYSNAAIGATAASDSLTYYAADKVHLNNTGSAVYAGLVQPAIYLANPAAAPPSVGGGGSGIALMDLMCGGALGLLG